MKYENEGMDCKKLLLLFLQKLWIVVLAAAIGAALGGGIYLLHHVILDSHREYQAESKIHLDFAPDESGEVYQEYNGYTWNDLLSTTLILDTTMSYLPETYTEEEVVAASSAQILSDLRFLTITVTTSDPVRTEEILKATDYSLVEMGKREKEFINIEIIKETEPAMVTVSPRLLQAVLLGFSIALVLSLLGMALFYVLEDKIYVPGDFKVITTLPFIGFSFGEEEFEMKLAGGEYQEKKSNRETKEKDKKQRLCKRLAEDLRQNQRYLGEKYGTLVTVELGKEQSVPEESNAELREADGVLLSVPYGKMSRTACAYQMEQLTLQDCNPVGMMIRDADMRFVKWYYNHL